VADGDGVVCVPREHAADAARAARKILDGDKAGRRKLYDKLGIPMDRTVQP
jgi:regulator of RNase E activity RraA